MNNSGTPTLHTFGEILADAAATWNSCEPFALSPWEVHLIFYLCLLLTFSYIYVIITVINCIRRLPAFRNPFYYCAVALAVGDLVTLLTCAREGPIQTCALRDIPARHIAWESVGAFSVDFIYSVNLVMAIVRLEAMFGIARNSSPKENEWILNILLLVAVLWACITSCLYYFGYVKKIWFTGDKYHTEFLFPFDVIRTPIQIIQLALTFIIYTAAFWQLREIRVTRSITQFNREYRFLMLAALIFVCELVYYYCTDWVGSLIFHLGSDEFNARLNYYLRPITTGITPIFYLIFSIDLRHACLHPFSSTKKPSSKVQPVTSSNPSLKYEESSGV